MKLLGSTKSKINRDTNGENVSHLEITEAVLIHCNFVKNDYQQDRRVLNSCLVNYQIFLKKVRFLKKFNSEFLYIKVY